MTRRLADAKAVNALVAKLAVQISRHNRGVKDLALVGIKRRECLWPSGSPRG